MGTFDTEDVTAAWAPPQATLRVATDVRGLDEYEVRLYDHSDGRRLVAAIELVSPANKDLPEHRRAFAAKCVALLQRRISVVIVDLVTTRHANLYAETLSVASLSDPLLEPSPPGLYAVACRPTKTAGDWHLETWLHPLALAQPLPTLPLWLADNLAIPLELEASYEETCRDLRIA